MTKKDYIKAVSVIGDACKDGCPVNPITKAFVAFFQGDNPRFDKERFLSAVEKETGITVE